MLSDGDSRSTLSIVPTHQTYDPTTTLKKNIKECFLLKSDLEACQPYKNVTENFMCSHKVFILVITAPDYNNDCDNLDHEGYQRDD